MSGSLDRYYRRKTADLEAARRRLEDKGRDLWSQATRSGQSAVGDTLGAIRRLAAPDPTPTPMRQTTAQPQTSKMMGRSYAQGAAGSVRSSGSPAPAKPQPTAPTLASGPMGRGYAAPPVRTNPPSAPTPSGERAAALLHGVSDGATFGAGDQASALFHAGLPGDGRWSERYHERMQVLRAQDIYDQEHYPMSRTAGQVAGAVATAFTPFGLEAGALKAASYFPKAAKFVKGATATKRISPLARGLRDHARWSAITAGAGGGMGVAGQGASDWASGQRSSLGSYGAAALGGGVDSLGTVYLGPGRGGALGGAVSAAADDAFNGRMPSLVRMSEGAAAGSVMGKGLGALGTFRVHALPGRNNGSKGLTKGALGESLSKARSLLEGEGIDRGSRRVEVGNRYTILDHKTRSGRPVEAKFGYAARLSTPQKMLRAKEKTIASTTSCRRILGNCCPCRSPVSALDSKRIVGGDERSRQAEGDVCSCAVANLSTVPIAGVQPPENCRAGRSVRAEVAAASRRISRSA